MNLIYAYALKFKLNPSPLLLNVSLDLGVVPMDWRFAFTVPLYKGKGDKCECGNSRGMFVKCSR